MARIRNIKPDFFTDSKVRKLTSGAKILFIGMWCYMDKLGIVEADIELLALKLFQDSQDVNTILAWCKNLVDVKLLKTAKWDDKWWFYSKSFAEHQHFHRDEKPKWTKIPISSFKSEWPEELPQRYGLTTESIMRTLCEQDASTPEIGDLRSEIGDLKSEILSSPSLRSVEEAQAPNVWPIVSGDELDEQLALLAEEKPLTTKPALVTKPANEKTELRDWALGLHSFLKAVYVRCGLKPELYPSFDGEVVGRFFTEIKRLGGGNPRKGAQWLVVAFFETEKKWILEDSQFWMPTPQNILQRSKLATLIGVTPDDALPDIEDTAKEFMERNYEDAKQAVPRETRKVNFMRGDSDAFEDF